MIGGSGFRMRGGMMSDEQLAAEIAEQEALKKAEEEKAIVRAEKLAAKREEEAKKLAAKREEEAKKLAEELEFERLRKLKEDEDLAKKAEEKLQRELKRTQEKDRPLTKEEEEALEKNISTDKDYMEMVKRNTAILQIRHSKVINPKSILADPRVYTSDTNIDSNKGYEIETIKDANRLIYEDGTPVFDKPLYNQEKNPIYYKDGKPIEVMYKDNYTGEYKPKPIAELTPYDTSKSPTLDPVSGNTITLGELPDMKNYYNQSINDKGGIRIQLGKLTGFKSPNTPNWIDENEFNGNPRHMIISNISTNSPELQAPKIYQKDGYIPSVLVRLNEGDFAAKLDGEFIEKAFIPEPMQYQGGASVRVKYNGRQHQVYQMKFNPQSGFDETIEEYAPTMPTNPTRQDKIKYTKELNKYNDTSHIRKKDKTNIYIPTKYFKYCEKQ